MSKNKVYVISGFFSDSRKEEIYNNSKGVIQFAADNLQRAIIQGFSENNVAPIIFNLPFIGSYPKRYKTFFFSNSKESFCNATVENLGFNNFMLFKFFSRYKSLVKNVKS